MFIYNTKINFYECDPAGILFFARIFNICHSAYEAMISEFQLEEDYWENDDYVVPIIHSEASYHKPIKYSDQVRIKITINQLRESSFELIYECRNESDELCTKVKTVHVFVDKGNWKKKKMSNKIFNELQEHKI